jgi:carbon-monoxide dehydrogenase small subunit
MTVGFILNGEDVVVQTAADKRLVDILRESFQLLKTKTGCRSGRCGCCSVLLNGRLVPSCLVPAFKVRGGEIVTIEGFTQTDEYQDIAAGFARSGIETCGYCDTAKIMTAAVLLERIAKPTKDEVLGAFAGNLCRCTNPGQLVDAVQSSAEIRQRRLYGRST